MPARAHAADLDSRRSEFRALYRANFAYVWRTLARYGVAEASLEDAAQEVFVVVLRRFGTWHSPDSLRSWLHGVARRVASAHRRRQRRHERKLEALPQAEAPRMMEDELHDRRRLDSLAAAIEGLDPGRREVYVLTEIEGLSAPEIAELLGCKLNTVYSRLRRARAQINHAMAAYYGGDDDEGL